MHSFSANLRSTYGNRVITLPKQNRVIAGIRNFLKKVGAQIIGGLK